MIKCHCDICGKETFINPPSETVMVEVEKEVPSFVGGKWVNEKRTIKVPEMTTMKVIDPHGSGKLIDHEIPKTKDLKPRMWRVQLRVGQESIDRDFCKDCLDKHLKSDLAKLRDLLEGIERK